LPKAALGIGGIPIAAVPELHSAAAILVFRNGAFEIAVVERMVLDLDREPLVVWIERGAARHRPGLEDAVEFEAQIVMQTRCRVLLDDETPLARRRHLDVTGGLRGFAEITLLAIDEEFLRSHGRPARSTFWAIMRQM